MEGEDMDSVLLVAPVTALEFVGDFLLAGEGPYLTVYHVKDTRINLQRIRQNVLHGYSVHGIKLRGAAPPCAAGVVLCVFGSKGLVILRLSVADDEVTLSSLGLLRELHDWIWDVQWLGCDTQATFSLALALGHNSVALYDHENGNVLKEVHCAEKCILYSAHFWGGTWEELVVVSGTVFNQLVVWRPSDQADGKVEPMRRISGHNGVIFSIFYDHRKGILASASDDRSLRVWDVGDLASPACDVHCLHVLYGHQSRVWSVRLLSDYIVSIGEDSACIVWDHAGRLVHRFKGHKGRGIRAVAVKEELCWVATGGADAAIRLWQVKGTSSLSGPQALGFSPDPHRGSPKALHMVDTTCLVVMTDLGFIFNYDFSSRGWNLVVEDESYASYSLLDAYKSPACVLCAIGNIRGSIKIFSLFSPSTHLDLNLFQGKVHSLTWTSPPCGSPGTFSLFSSGPDGLMVWMKVACSPGLGLCVTEKLNFALPACRQRWHTCAAFLPQHDFIVVGDRRGSLMLFPVRGAAADSAEEHHTLSTDGTIQSPSYPVSTLFGLHGKLGVTSVICIDGFVYSTGRDGLYRQLVVRGDCLVLLRKVKACKGMEWIESLSFTSGGNLLVLGFHSTDFVVWSTRTNEKLHCVPCGGGHRSWSYREDEDQVVFVFIKSGDLLIYQRHKKESVHGVIKEPMHGRELTCVRYVGAIGGLHDERLHVLITSSEDTTVNIFSFSEDSGQVRQLATISDHLSNVRALAIAGTQGTAGDLTATLITAGGRAQIECYQVQLTRRADSASCHVVHLASHRLDQHWDRMKNKHKSVKVDPETRYMSIAPVSGIPGVRATFLAAACSDGSVRFFVLCDRSQRLVLAAQSFYHQRCVLKVDTLVYPSHDGPRVLLCSAASDGRIAFWDISSTMARVHTMLEAEAVDLHPLDVEPMSFTVSAHQSGINSLHIRETARGQHLVATGGDDNSLHICLLTVTGARDFDGKPTVRLVREFSVSSAHSAQVTGLRILRDDLLASASVDQRLTLWSLGDRGPRHLSTRFCHVADVSELDCWVSRDAAGRFCVLCGQGLEIIKCPDVSRPCRDGCEDAPSM
uniref:tRNA (34-2'-O)-methyltransferase regulator WDR6 n=1 Tax=Leptobrachium leishanense TaxID=445787 RepID=A0A8C5MUL5_9ANUR